MITRDPRYPLEIRQIPEQAPRPAWCDRCGADARWDVTDAGSTFAVRTYYCERCFRREHGHREGVAA